MKQSSVSAREPITSGPVNIALITDQIPRPATGESDRRTTREAMMGKRASVAKKLNKEAKGNGSSVDQQILATLKEILSSLQSIQSEMPSGLPVDTLTREQRLDDILRELRRHRPARS